MEDRNTDRRPRRAPFPRAIAGRAAATVLLLGCALPLAAQSDDPIMKAMSDEIKRSMERLQIKGADKPYFIQYRIADMESYTVSATFGALVRSDHDRERPMRTEVRVGSYALDNSGFIKVADLFSFGDRTEGDVVIEDDYNAIRHDLWLSTDAAYKKAIGAIAGKRAAMQNKVEDETIPDFSREDPVSVTLPRATLAFEKRRWEEQVREWSAIFRKFPAVQQSSVTVRAQATNRYLINSEGSAVRQPATIVTVEVRAAAQADDGMKMSRSLPISATSIDGLPASSEITAAITRMAEDLTALRTAPLFDESYSGPVLFTAAAAPDFFAQMLAPELSGERPGMVDEPRMMGSLGRTSQLAGRIDRPVLPASFTVVDDPTRAGAGNAQLLGSYKADDEGVAASRVTLVENGVLKTLLMSRRPRKDITKSNGHARAGETGAPAPRVGNLIVSASGAKSYEELKKELIETCTTRKMPYGMIVKALSTRGEDDAEEIIMFSMGGGESKSAVTPPALAYKVYPDGREELVRGVTIPEVSLRTLRDITAAAGDANVLNNDGRSAGSFSISGGLFGGGYGVTSSVVAPSFIVDELELKRASGSQQKPALLSHPFFGK